MSWGENNIFDLQIVQVYLITFKFRLKMIKFEIYH